MPYDKVQRYVDTQISQIFVSCQGALLNTYNLLMYHGISHSRLLTESFTISGWLLVSISFTRAENMRTPDKLTCVKRVVKAWQTVATDVIVKSFSNLSSPAESVLLLMGVRMV